MRYLNSYDSKDGKDWIRFDYHLEEGNKYRTIINDKINTTIKAMYFKTPSNPIEWITTFFKCIIRGLK